MVNFLYCRTLGQINIWHFAFLQMHPWHYQQFFCTHHLLLSSCSLHRVSTSMTQDITKPTTLFSDWGLEFAVFPWGIHISVLKSVFTIKHREKRQSCQRSHQFCFYGKPHKPETWVTNEQKVTIQTTKWLIPDRGVEVISQHLRLIGKILVHVPHDALSNILKNGLRCRSAGWIYRKQYLLVALKIQASMALLICWCKDV